MWMSAAVFLLSAFIAGMEIPALIRKGWFKELWIFTILLLLGAGFTVALTLDVKLPDPFLTLRWIFKPIADWITFD